MSLTGQNPIDETSYRLNGDFTSNPLSNTLLQCFFDALALKNKLSSDVLTMEGMSGRKYRYFINNLIGSMNQPRYLEVGSWMGSTACAAIYGNALDIVCIDNWSLFGGPKDEFIKNVSNNLNPNVNFKFIENDFRKINFAQLGMFFNVYLFDGPHEERDQFDGIIVAQPALTDSYILIVDDWNWRDVQNGTRKALSHLKSSVLCSIEIQTNQHNNHPVIEKQFSEWHNGYYFAVIQKNPQ